MFTDASTLYLLILTNNYEQNFQCKVEYVCRDWIFLSGPSFKYEIPRGVIIVYLQLSAPLHRVLTELKTSGPNPNFWRKTIIKLWSIESNAFSKSAEDRILGTSSHSVYSDMLSTMHIDSLM